jgi:hypothetical protein
MARPERVALRPLSEAGREVLGPLLGRLPAHSGATISAIVRTGSGENVGALAHRLSGGWLLVEGVALTDAARIAGYGADAVRLLERQALTDGGVRRFGLAVPKGDGLALYAALRLGYRPARPGDGRWRGGPRGDIIAMVRTPGGRD